MREFRAFLKEAHRRGLRVITELVLNHTSDQHPWFQKARHAKPGSAARNFYVWSDSPEKYTGTRIIFQDFEHSNWTWDHVAKAYYWHRFYSHQPDLNWDNPAVRRAMLQVLDFWLDDVGVDGLRLDAVPYLFEREGTNNENLPETHAALKDIRRVIDERYPGKMLLAEANQWPEDAVAYFGKGDECHTAFHFPLMPRLFMGIRTEDRYPIVDMLEQTPAIPETCQWVLFLRNHDELTLEMVTDEERDYMYRVYAQDQQARINLGIRRRLAPLLGNSRRKIELMNALLLSLPGTPVLYYGDEIGMGDNFYLGDRNGVRTPDAVEPGPQRRLLPRQLPEAVLPRDHRPRVPLRGGERRGAAGQPAVAAVVDEAHPERAQAVPRLRPRDLRVPVPRQQQGAGLRARARGRAHPGGGQPLALRAARGAEPGRLQGRDAGGAVRAHALPRRRPTRPTRWPWGRTPSTGSRWRRRPARATAERAATVPPVVWGGSLEDLLAEANRDALESVLPADPGARGPGSAAGGAPCSGWRSWSRWRCATRRCSPSCAWTTPRARRRRT